MGFTYSNKLFGGAGSGVGLPSGALTAGRVVLAAGPDSITDDAGLLYNTTTNSLDVADGRVQAMNLKAISLPAAGSINVTPVLSQVGAITVVAGAALVDGDALSVGDGTGVVPIEFDASPGDGTTGGAVPIIFDGTETATAIRDAVKAILDASGRDWTTSNQGADGIGLVRATPGVTGGAITESVADAGFSVTDWTDPTHATTYTYRLVAVAADGTRTAAGATSTTNLGVATLSASNYNALSWSAVSGAASYEVYRTVGGATQGRIYAGTALAVNDTGLAGNGLSAPSVDETGVVTAKKLVGPSGASVAVPGAGTNSVAVGTAVTSSATAATAIGDFAYASGAYGVAIGNDSRTTQSGGVAIGYGARAIVGAFSTAVGYGAIAASGAQAFGSSALASASSSLAVGYSASVAATETDSTAVGRLAVCNGTGGGQATAVGGSAASNGYRATALGYKATGSGVSATAIGRGAVATGSHAIAVGRGAWASANNSIAIGFSGGDVGTDVYFESGHTHKYVEPIDGTTITRNPSLTPIIIHGFDAYDATASPTNDVAGGDLIAMVGRGTGTADGGTFRVQVAPPSGVSSNTKNTAVDAITVESSGVVSVLNLPVYADNAAALAGSLVAGNLYRTATGVLMVVYTP